VKTESEVLEKHRQFIKEGWEGTMVRNLDSLYKLNSRSSDLLKLKDFNDDEFKVIGYKAGTGKFINVPTFQMVTAAGHEFEGVPKGTEEQRKQYLDNGRNYIGKLATVRFFGYTTTDNPVPRFPVIVDLNRKE
jgi:DNA ligase-1